jgi:hypothetical protein
MQNVAFVVKFCSDYNDAVAEKIVQEIKWEKQPTAYRQ